MPLTSFRTLDGAVKGRIKPGIKEVKRYFKALGYLDNAAVMDDMFDKTLESAIESYQRFYHLTVTRELDADTLKQMSVPRCGVRDPVHPRHAEKNSTKPSESQTAVRFSFTSGKPRWGRTQTQLTYAFSGEVRSLGYGVSFDQWRGACANAFKRWEDESVFTFREASSDDTPNIKISFERGDHGDGDPFDGTFYAHAFPPKDGRFHYDADWQWSINPREDQVDLESVAVHEIGHLLGLDHSEFFNAIMYPYLPLGHIRRNLRRDDIEGIHHLYHPEQQRRAVHSWPSPSSSSSSPPPLPPAAVPSESTAIYKGPVCDNAFSSYQALRGHKVGHRILTAAGDVGSGEQLHDAISQLSKLKSISLTTCMIVGKIPAELGSLKNLTQLKLYYNRLVGGIPEELGDFTELIDLDMSVNLLTGRIPEAICRLPHLKVLQVYNNSLGGEQPESDRQFDNPDPFVNLRQSSHGGDPLEFGAVVAFDRPRPV